MGKVFAVRICRWKTVEEAFSGKGSRLRAGRWYGTGTEVVCASNSTALAVLENLNYINGATDLLTGFWAYELLFSEDLIRPVDLKPLGEKWREPHSNPQTRAIGDTCFLKNLAPILQVPSVTVASKNAKTGAYEMLDINGHNYLLFPRHPQFKKITIRGPYQLELDQRLINLVSSRDILVESPIMTKGKKKRK